MKRVLLNDGWTVKPGSNAFEDRLGLGSAGVPVTLPHDAMLETSRSPLGNAATAFYDGGEWEYHRTLEHPRPGGAVCLEFEGVYRDALVLVNDNPVAHRPSGYAGFVVQIDHLLRSDEANRIRVVARSHQDSRWYPGGGIYRNVWLLVAGHLHLAPEGVQVLTPEVDDDVAVVEVRAPIRNQSPSSSRALVRVEVRDESGAVVAHAEAPATAFPGDAVGVRQRLCVTAPRRWGPDHPYLYQCLVTLLNEGEGVALDEESTTFGIRTLSLDPVRGLRVNGAPVLLRGACVHHDNGPLGAATIDRAEERRVELLRAAGFNAIRSAHNPLSKAMLAACDSLGLFVMDEAFDMWEQPKSEHDYALHFAEWWEADLEAMVRKDINHPSVILYSIGNEIPEAGQPHGSRRGRALAEKIRSLDPCRFVTEAVTGLLVGGPEMFDELRSRVAEATEKPGDGSADAVPKDLTERLNAMMLAPSIGRHSAETFSYLDVAGYNYMELRYEPDGEAYPNRVIVGTETHPAAIDTGWAAVRRLSHVIGDFTWTGWDYLGEVGIGRTVYTEPDSTSSGRPSFLGEYPWRAAWCGDLDITGQRRPQSYYREIVFGLRADPYMAVRRPEHHGKPAGLTPWSWTDCVSSWSWDGHEGAPVTVEVYADAEEVELLVNGRSIGTRPAGPSRRYRAEFETVYEAGVLEAVARRAGTEIGRAALRSAKGPVQMDVRADRAAIGAQASDLAYVAVTLVDDEGALYASADRRVSVAVEGTGVLQALGSANPMSEEGFGGTTCTTFDGRALAVVRPNGTGQIVVTVTAEGCDPQSVRIDAGT